MHYVQLFNFIYGKNNNRFLLLGLYSFFLELVSIYTKPVQSTVYIGLNAKGNFFSYGRQIVVYTIWDKLAKLVLYNCEICTELRIFFFLIFFSCTKKNGWLFPNHNNQKNIKIILNNKLFSFFVVKWPQIERHTKWFKSFSSKDLLGKFI